MHQGSMQNQQGDTIMNRVQQPVVAGTFYPDTPEELRQQVRTYLDAAIEKSTHPKALIAPHAGYIYSGPVAGSAYAQLEDLSGQITRVVILAPSHHLAFHGIACSSANRFSTPLGILEVDEEARKQVLDLPQVEIQDDAFAREHSLEVHLPFIQEALGEIQIVPLVVGDAQPTDVEAVLERLWGGDETLIVISSDLSHYLDYESACETDAATSRAIEGLQPEAISQYQACGRIPVAGLLLAARNHHLKAVTLDQRNSGDTAGPRDRVVGYGAYALF
jgi:AmmeMemoRadiSam system protein B